MSRHKNSIAFFSSFTPKRYMNSFGRNSKNTWYELPEKTRIRLRRILEDRDGLECNKKYGHGCGRKMESGKLSVDHIIPIRAGGPVVDIGNLQLLCYSCHHTKTFTKDILYSTSFRASYLSRVPSGSGRKAPRP